MNYKSYLKKLLEKTVKEKASDLHICAGHPPILRIATELVVMEGEKKLSRKDTKKLSFLLMNEAQKEKFLEEKTVDFSYSTGSIGRFRCNVYFEQGKVRAALRFIPSKIKTIEELNLPPILHEFADASHGFVLITGASSQGKSTTLASLIDEINRKRKEHVITIEDPIEYIFEDNRSLVDQREVGKDTLSFNKALRSTLREDPDVIMVGEMRDLETISMAITAAETGHLVFATLHTNSSSQTIHRIIDVFPSSQQSQIRAQLSGSLSGVVSQRLVLTEEEKLFPACEVMFNNSAVSNLIRENRIHELPSVIETSREEGMIPLNKSLVNLVEQGRITEHEALNYSLNPKDLSSRLKGTL